MPSVIRFVIFIIIGLIQTTSFAQRKIDGHFLIAKLGLFDSRESGGIAFSIEGGILKNNTIIGISCSGMPQFFGENFTNSVDVTIGKFKAENSSLFFHAQVGIGVVWGAVWETSEENTVNFTKACLPLKAGIKFIPPNFVSIGIDFQANINSQEPIFLVMATLGVWHLHPK